MFTPLSTGSERTQDKLWGMLLLPPGVEHQDADMCASSSRPHRIALLSIADRPSLRLIATESVLPCAYPRFLDVLVTLLIFVTALRTLYDMFALLARTFAVRIHTSAASYLICLLWLLSRCRACSDSHARPRPLHPDAQDARTTAAADLAARTALTHVEQSPFAKCALPG